MADSTQDEADRRLEAALREHGARDPREFYRTQLKELREVNPQGYQDAVAYYRNDLIPAIGRDGQEPLAAWTDYGHTLATLRAAGRTVAVDATGQARAFERPARLDDLVLHLPDEQRTRAILVALPPRLSPAQRATFDWLVSGRLKLREDEE
ncbi:MAG TPA: hypothetical protein VLA43_18515 [Longimicrobiales bacterium]|nr:hypothetical protein [Longimicrobiales bacterium]